METSYNTVLKHLPLATMDVAAAHTVVPFYRDWVRSRRRNLKFTGLTQNLGQL
jgi:hypothetical protein